MTGNDETTEAVLRVLDPPLVASRGLGLLSDGFVSDNSPFEETNPNGSWIGWSKHHTDGTVTLLFEFDQLRNFSEILLAAYGHRLNSIDVIFR
ncbi:unnamed protein product [Strongylus vulgaris]|uniref:Discoidin domain-containing protein n=1 Tax=Strongylus vulgaris TaxID=40348 RepID=A0A3P7LRJ2_STRVU|nr:unnamed protein product [Strongylus vulgaris]